MRKSWLACALVVLAGCAGLPQHVIKYRSEALRSPESTALGRIVEAAEEGRPRNLSGVRLLTSGEEAFDSLLTLADHAERTLDIQYYIIHQDESARILLQHVRAPPTAACACACSSMISTPPGRTGASCT